MPEPAATVVARLSTDAATARTIDEALTQDLDEVATTAFEEPDGRWSLAARGWWIPKTAPKAEAAAEPAPP